MSSRLSDAKLKKEQAKWSKKTHALTSKIEKKKAEQTSIQNRITKLSDSLNNKDYADAQSSYNDLQQQSDKLKTKISKSKSTKTKTGLQNQLNDLLTKKATYANKMRNIADKNGFADKNNELKNLRSSAANLVKFINSLNSQLSKSQSKENNYKSIRNSRRMARNRSKNAPKIANKIKNSQGNTTIFRTDMQSDDVFSLVETSPSETDSNDVATKPIDGQTVQTNWISQSSREYTGTFYLKGDSFEACDTQFRKLMDWSFKYEFTINGFSRWTHAYITSIAKSTDETISQNGMIITITFSYARQAVIKYKSETKGSTKHKAGTKVMLGNHNGKSNAYVRVKPGMTLEQVSRKTGVSLSTLMKYNPGKLTTHAKVRLS